jgi:hypothetical protein
MRTETSRFKGSVPKAALELCPNTEIVLHLENAAAPAICKDGSQISLKFSFFRGTTGINKIVND